MRAHVCAPADAEGGGLSPADVRGCVASDHEHACRHTDPSHCTDEVQALLEDQDLPDIGPHDLDQVRKLSKKIQPASEHGFQGSPGDQVEMLRAGRKLGYFLLKKLCVRTRER